MTSVKSTRKNKYRITINMETSLSNLLLDKEQIPYPQSQSYRDELTVKENRIEIISMRSGIVDLKGVFLNHQSALYRQITKSLVYYYCATRKPTQIKKIKIERMTKKFSTEVVLNKKDITQVVNSEAEIGALQNINLNALKLVFLENRKAHGFLFGLTYLIKSLHADSKLGMFENKWKAFNAIYKAAANATKDFDCHLFIRNDLIDNPNFYPLILGKVSELTGQDIRANTRWIKFIHNNYSTINQTRAFKDFVLRNEDYRIKKIVYDTLTVRETFLKEKGFYDEVVNHLNTDEATVNNSHLAATLCIKYAYFARNKLMHAENIESGFRLVPLNKEENELSWLSSLLVLLIQDLININHRF
ncbi:hypothetical protein [Alteromonas stellipolaris]|uniref:hypothetical protein n=1 Tax=Alteromonas stellipolaris TaxID=233316 RepID=UPI0027360023|nr:hypothetical protein [Alteromonas stellipolaris]MDP2594825.1 hypothetical protein [Alteromonas stellipolaris]